VVEGNRLPPKELLIVILMLIHFSDSLSFCEVCFATMFVKINYDQFIRLSLNKLYHNLYQKFHLENNIEKYREEWIKGRKKQ